MKISNNKDFIDNSEFIWDLILKKKRKGELFKDIPFDFKTFGNFEEEIYLKLFFNKIGRNLEVINYLRSKKAPLNKKENGEYDFEYFAYEKLYIDILLEKISKHKIILLDATPLPKIVDRIRKMENFKEIRLNDDLFDKKTSLLRICREGRPVKTSRETLISRIKKNKTPLLEDKSYIPIIETYKNLNEFTQLKNINLGVVSYKSLQIKGLVEPLELLKKELSGVHTLHFGNSRGRSELNECEILYILGTDRHPALSRYNLYRYLDGEKTTKELENKRGWVDKLTYNDELFNEIINHQIDSEMEQVIFRNMPHMKKRLTILEGHLPSHLEKYFKEVFTFNIKFNSQKIIFPILIKEFLKSLSSGENFSFKKINEITQSSFSQNTNILGKINKKETEKNRKKVKKKIKKYKKHFPTYTLKGIYGYMVENDPELMKNAKIKTFSTFKKIYSTKK